MSLPKIPNIPNIPKILSFNIVTTDTVSFAPLLRLRVDDRRSPAAHEGSQRLVDVAKDVAAVFGLSPRAFTFIRGVGILFQDNEAALIVTTYLPDRERHADYVAGDPILARFNRYFSYFAPIDRKLFWEVLRNTLMESITHEMDECIYDRGERPFDPHKGDAPVFENDR